MSNVSALSPKLIAAIESGATVISPTQRSAHWLKLSYADYAVKKGRKTWLTPAVHSFDAFVSRLWRVHGVSAERVLSTEQCKLLWTRIVSTSRWSSLLLSPQDAAASSFQSWERMQEWRISKQDLRSQLVLVDSDEARALLEWHERFDDLCTARSWLPSAYLPRRLQQIDTLQVSDRIVTIGADEQSPNQQALFAYLRDRGTTWDQHRAPDISTKCRALACDSAELELWAAAAWARERCSAGRKSIAVVVPELAREAPRVRRVFSEVFAQATRTFGPNTDRSRDKTHAPPFVIAGYRRLGEFPIVRSALDLLALITGRADSALIGSTLRNPFLRGCEIENDKRALIDAELRAHSRERYDLSMLSRLIGQMDCPIFSEILRTAEIARSRVPPHAMPSAMSEHFVALWRSFGWPGDRSLDSDEQQIVARVQACLGEFGALDELLGELKLASAVHEFEQLVHDTYFEPRRLPAPITIVDANSTHGLQFDAAWIAGFDETRWPPPASPDPFIPIELQKQARLPQATAQLVREHAHHRFLELESIADEVVFSWATHDADVDILPSPWLMQVVAPGKYTTKMDSYAARLFAAKPAIETLKETTGPAFVDKRARGGARLFELQSLCPFRAFAELRLSARPLAQVGPDIDARDRGVLVHAALADIWKEIKSSEGLRSCSHERLEVLVRTALARHAARLIKGASTHRVRMLQIEQELAAERLLALLELDRQRPSFRVVGVPETAEQASIESLEFELRLDRVDELVGGALSGQRIIVDYKTGNVVSVQSWLRDRPEMPQIPLYAITHPQALVAVAFATVGARGAAYQGIAREEGVLPGVRAFSDRSFPAQPSQWEALLAHWRRVVSRLANEFVAGHAHVDPLPNACRVCHLSVFCRIDEQKTAGMIVPTEDVE